MKAVIIINMNNAAFTAKYDQDLGEGPGNELGRILKTLGEIVQSNPGLGIGYSIRVHDVNGNDVGGLQVK